MARGISVMLALGLALTGGGCATVTRGTDESVAFDTVPSGADIRASVIDNRAGDTDTYQEKPREMACVTPCVLNLRRVDKMDITVSKAGFQPEAFTLKPAVSAAGAATSVGNALAGGVAGLVLDAASGAGLDKCPNPVRITLRPLGRRSEPASAVYDPAAGCKAQTDAGIKAADPGLAKRTPAI